MKTKAKILFWLLMVLMVGAVPVSASDEHSYYIYSPELGAFYILSDHPITQPRLLNDGRMFISVSEGTSVIISYNDSMTSPVSAHKILGDSIEYIEGASGSNTTISFTGLNEGTYVIQWKVPLNKYNESTALISLIAGQLNIADAVIQLFSFVLGDFFILSAFAIMMFLSAMKFQHISAGAFLGFVFYFTLLPFMTQTCATLLGLGLALYVAYALYSIYTREDR